ncbi:MAG: hypothetical protein IJS50_05980, partial [Desulfovibrio sp.]|nr:hypothetical protein [Desulfovibrio sp.]
MEKMENMPKYKDLISLIPYGLPQFLDFEVPMQSVRKVSLTVMEELEESSSESELLKMVRLNELVQDEDGEFVHPVTKAKVDESA